jgi:hypothetical protein
MQSFFKVVPQEVYDKRHSEDHEAGLTASVAKAAEILQAEHKSQDLDAESEHKVDYDDDGSDWDAGAGMDELDTDEGFQVDLKAVPEWDFSKLTQTHVSAKANSCVLPCQERQTV